MHACMLACLHACLPLHTLLHLHLLLAVRALPRPVCEVSAAFGACNRGWLVLRQGAPAYRVHALKVCVLAWRGALYSVCRRRPPLCSDACTSDRRPSLAPWADNVHART